MTYPRPVKRKHETMQQFFTRTQEVRGEDSDTYEDYVKHRLNPRLSLATRAALAGFRDARTIAKYDMIDDEERKK